MRERIFYDRSNHIDAFTDAEVICGFVLIKRGPPNVCTFYCILPQHYTVISSLEILFKQVSPFFWCLNTLPTWNPGCGPIYIYTLIQFSILNFYRFGYKKIVSSLIDTINNLPVSGSHFQRCGWFEQSPPCGRLPFAASRRLSVCH